MDIRSRIIRPGLKKENEIIIIEGNDGAGKTTYCEYLKKVYKEQNKNYCYFHFPIMNENHYSPDIIDKKYIILLDPELLKIDDENKKQDLIFDNIEQNSGIIINLYSMGYNIIIDRYIISNKIYRLLNNCPERNNTLPICIVLSYSKLFMKLRYPNSGHNEQHEYKDIFHWKSDPNKVNRLIELFNDYVIKYNLDTNSLNLFPDQELEYKLGILGYK